MIPSLKHYLTPLPIIAILRGITPDEAVPVAEILYEAGFRIIEVPLNSPRAFESIRLLTAAHGERCLIGAGTVLAHADIAHVREAGGRIIVTPHCDTSLVREAKRQGLACVPGVATPTEAFAALAAGADALKLFPAEALPPAALKAWRAVLPPATLVFAVGGIKPDTMSAYWQAGASGFGTGSNLYQPGASADEVRHAAAAFAAAFRALSAK